VILLDTDRINVLQSGGPEIDRLKANMAASADRDFATMVITIEEVSRVPGKRVRSVALARAPILSRVGGCTLARTVLKLGRAACVSPRTGRAMLESKGGGLSASVVCPGATNGRGFVATEPPRTRR
jgi:hypothetical protein